MKSGRKNLKKASAEDCISLQEGQSIMQVVSLRGSNVIEVIDAEGVKSLALFPAKFQRSFWIKTGNFVIVDEGGREKALESGDKIACIVTQVLFHAQVRYLERSPGCLFKYSIGNKLLFYKLGIRSVLSELPDVKKLLNFLKPRKLKIWPASFKNARHEEPKTSQLLPESYHGEVLNSDSEDDLPPLEANLNRRRPVEIYSNSDSDPDS